MVEYQGGLMYSGFCIRGHGEGLQGPSEICGLHCVTYTSMVVELNRLRISVL